MCQSMVNIQSPTAEIRRGKKEERRRRRNSTKIYMVSLLHRATIITGNWVVNLTSIVVYWYVCNAAMTLANVLATIPLFFFCRWHCVHALSIAASGAACRSLPSVRRINEHLKFRLSITHYPDALSTQAFTLSPLSFHHHHVRLINNSQ